MRIRHPVVGPRQIADVAGHFGIFRFDLEIVGGHHVIADRHLLITGGERATAIVVQQRRGLRNVDAFVRHQVIGAGHPVPVWRLVLAHEQERLLSVAAVPQPIQRKIGDDVRHVALDLLVTRGCSEIRVVVVPLTRQHLPEVEALRLGAQVPLPDHRGLVPGSLQHLIERRLRHVERIPRPVVDLAVDVAVLAGEHHRAAGGTDRIGAEAVQEDRAFISDPVDVRSLIDARAVGRDGLSGVVVGENEDDVRALLPQGRRTAGQQRK